MPGVSTAICGLLLRPVGRDAFERPAQVLGIGLDRRHLEPLEQVRRELQHRLAVLEHVAHARRRPEVVLEDVEIVGPDPHDVDADDVRVDAARRVQPHHLRQERRVLEDQLLGNPARP